MSVRVAVIGAGIMGADHARIVARDLPGATLQVVCDASEARARAVAEETGAADVATDPEATIARSDVDAVLIATPDPTHAPLTLAALAAGKPALCEKPLAPGTAGCLEVIEAETRLGRRLVQLGFMRRFDPGYAEMRRTAREGRIGGLLMMHNFHRNMESPGAWFTGDMAISNSASHEFDIARFVVGGEYESITAFQPERRDGTVAPVLIVLRTAGGQLVNIEINNNAGYGYDVRGELVGERGSVSLNAGPATRLDLDLRQSLGYAADWRPRFAEAYRLQNRDWLRSVETGTPSAIAADAWDGYAAAAAGEAGVRALREGRTVAVEMAPRPALYDPSREAAA